MKLKQIVDTDYVNYRLPSMYLATCYCDWKCCSEAGIPITVCQNNPIITMPDIEVPADEILRRYLSNPLSKAFVFAGLEPFKQTDELLRTIAFIREAGCEDNIVIYTGYTEVEIDEAITPLRQFRNIIVKFGRFQPNHQPHYDNILGVHLASDKQYAKRISSEEDVIII